MEREIKESCKSCKHHRKAQRLVNEEWEQYDVCVLYLDDKDGLILDLSFDLSKYPDFCECWEAAK